MYNCICYDKSFCKSQFVKPILKVDNVGGFKVGQWVLGLILALAHLVVQLRALRGRKNITKNIVIIEARFIPEVAQGMMCTHMGWRFH